MFLTIVVLVPPADSDRRVDPDDVRGALLRHAPVDDTVQHIRVLAFDREARVGLLTLADSQVEADRNTSQLCLAALAVEPALAGWTLRISAPDQPW